MIFGNRKKNVIYALGPISIILIALAYCSYFSPHSGFKLYWFIPDGLRAEPITFKVFEWAEQGRLPNIKKLIERGSYGHSRPSYPGHTPTNFATLFTGKVPKEHGVADGPMHLEGRPLNRVSLSGFSSHAKTSSAIWNFLERDFKQKVALVSLPGSTPPELQQGITLKGRWGGWGVEFPATVFHSANDLELQKRQGPGNRLFGFGNELTKFVDMKPLVNWNVELPQSFSPLQEIEMSQWGSTTYAVLADSKDDGIVDYDHMMFSQNKKNIIADLKQGEWSEWKPITLIWNRNAMGESEAVKINSSVRINVIRLTGKDGFRVRLLFDGLNEYLVNPPQFYAGIHRALGPMVDYVDSFPPQLIFHEQDKQTFMEELDQSFNWHQKMVGHAIDVFKSDVIIHDIYSPNQMLTSRWWMGYLDPKSLRYNTISEGEREKLWNEVFHMYKKMDDMIGEAIDRGGKDSYIVLSSDHGAIPLDHEVRLNNLFAQKGWLSYKMDKRTGKYEIDWKKTKVIFLKMNAVYINPDGLDGNYVRAKGPAYIKLRNQVIETLKKLKDERGVFPLAKVVTWENAGEMDLPSDRAGDLVISNIAGYGWIEDIDYQGRVFKQATKSGYKQAVDTNNPGMWTPFVIAGPGIKAKHQLSRLIDHQEQFDVLMNIFRKEKVESKLWKELTQD